MASFRRSVLVGEHPLNLSIHPEIALLQAFLRLRDQNVNYRQPPGSP